MSGFSAPAATERATLGVMERIGLLDPSYGASSSTESANAWYQRRDVSLRAMHVSGFDSSSTTDPSATEEDHRVHT